MTHGYKLDIGLHARYQLQCDNDTPHSSFHWNAHTQAQLHSGNNTPEGWKIDDFPSTVYTQ